MMDFKKSRIEMCVPPWLVFIVSFAVTLWLWHTASVDNHTIRKARFQNRVSLVTARIHEEIKDIETLLHGCDGLFAAGSKVSRAEWRSYINSLYRGKDLTGLQGLGFAQRVSAADLASHVQNIQAEGFATYTVKPEGERAEYFPIIYLEPFHDRNLRAFGYDMFSEPTRRAAMEKARDEGTTTVSGKVTLVQEKPDEIAQAGFLIYHPLYSGNTASATLNDRRQMLTGFAYSPIRFGDFLNALDLAKKNWVGISVYDGDESDPACLAYESSTDPESEKLSAAYVPSFVAIEKIPVYGRTWTIKLISMPSFDLASDSSKPLYILFLGFLISCLLAEASRIVRSRNQALQVVEQMKTDLEIRVREQTEDLRKSNRLLRMLSDWNQTLIRAESETHLLETMTDLLIKIGGYQCCLVGYPENDATQSIRPVAQRGFEEDQLKTIDLSWAEAEVADRPLGMAIRGGRHVIVNDVLTEPGRTH
ncbi:MAG: CHASE domain-containing protein [Candidatus Riflebacteria bacterium]|nr:CHASE domain-containing protein [Candidatus Riflebacteria bacterium]